MIQMSQYNSVSFLRSTGISIMKSIFQGLCSTLRVIISWISYKLSSSEGSCRFARYAGSWWKVAGELGYLLDWPSHNSLDFYSHAFPSKYQLSSWNTHNSEKKLVGDTSQPYEQSLAELIRFLSKNLDASRWVSSVKTFYGRQWQGWDFYCEAWGGLSRKGDLFG